MSLHDGSRFRGRFVDIAGDGKKVFAFACGESVCTGETHQGRFVYVVGDKKVFAFASEGCQPPVDPGFGGLADDTCVDETAYVNALSLLPFFVEADAYPPHGMSRLIGVRASAFLNCPEYDCKVAYLVYQEPGTVTSTPCDSKETIPSGRGVWTGCIGKIDIHVWLNPSVVTVGDRIRYCLSGCIDDDPHGNGPHSPLFGHLETDPNCHFAAASLDSPVSMGEVFVRGCCDPECADDALFHVALEFRSFCGGFRSARFVDVAADGKKVFAFADCNTPEACTPNPQNCCGPLRNCNITATIPGGDLAGSYTLVPDNHILDVFPMGWRSATAFAACGRLWSIEAGCRPHPTDPTKTIWNAGIMSGDVDCTCTTTFTEVEVEMSCFPLDVEITLPMTCIPDPGCEDGGGNPISCCPDATCSPTSVTVVLTL